MIWQVLTPVARTILTWIMPPILKQCRRNKLENLSLWSSQESLVNHFIITKIKPIKYWTLRVLMQWVFVKKLKANKNRVFKQGIYLFQYAIQMNTILHFSTRSTSRIIFLWFRRDNATCDKKGECCSLIRLTVFQLIKIIDYIIY